MTMANPLSTQSRIHIIMQVVLKLIRLPFERDAGILNKDLGTCGMLGTRGLRREARINFAKALTYEGHQLHHTEKVANSQSRSHAQYHCAGKWYDQPMTMLGLP